MDRPPLVARVTEQDGRPELPRLTEQRGQGATQLLRPKGLVLEERELPAVERLRQRNVGVRERKPRDELTRQLGAERVEPRRLARRLRRSDRQRGPDAERTPVEPLEQHRPCGDGRSRREPQGRNGVRELGRRVRWLGAGLERSLELEHAIPVDLPPEARREQSLRLGPVVGKLARRGRPQAQPSPRSTCVTTEIPMRGATAA